MSREHAYAYEAGYRDGSINYELEHCPACKNVADLQEALAENAKLRELSSIMLKCIMANERKKLICWECSMHKQFDELRSYCCLEHEAKKLGVEVG